MGMIIGWLSGKKTYLAGLAGIVIGLASLVGITVGGGVPMTQGEAMQLIVTSLIGIFIRNGISTTVIPR